MTKEALFQKLGHFIHASQFDDKKNQIILQFQNGRMFQSYKSIIAVEVEDKTYFGNDWDYSRTTSKYRNLFTGLDSTDTRKAIDNGEIILVDM